MPVVSCTIFVKYIFAFFSKMFLKQAKKNTYCQIILKTLVFWHLIFNANISTDKMFIISLFFLEMLFPKSFSMTYLGAKLKQLF